MDKQLMRQMQQTHGQRPDVPPAVGAGADVVLLSEALSAWMDGEALPAGVDEGMVVQWLLHDARAQEKWQQWHACLDWRRVTASDVAVPRVGPEEVGSIAWNARLQQRLAQTRMGSGENVSASGTALRAGASAALVVESTAGATGPMRATGAEAANDPVWRWKLAAGFASVAAAGAIVWGVLGQRHMPGTAEALLAATNNGPSAVARQEAAADPADTVRPPASRAAGQPLPAGAVQTLLAATSGEDAYADALMQAHARLGENLLLHDALFAEQDELP